jgi:eukaryotic-like serine/threonine-protein kinase
MDDIAPGNDKNRAAGEPAPGGDATQIDVRKRVDEAATMVVSDADLVAASSARTLAADGATEFGGSGTLLQIGSVLGNRYEILQLLGEGGMGAVYKARDVELERDVALKVIKSELADHPEILRRFKQELILARQVTDRNVIRIFDIGEAGKTKFITMEYLEGENLHQILKQRGKLEVAEAVDIMEQAASGLAAAHREGIIHRDLKPGNIMRDKSGRVVVMDFGLARTFSGDGMTRTGAMLGTIEYMSPEQAQGKELKASSDVFTFGLILYELVSGVMPFQAESAIASLLMRTQQRALPLSDVDKNVPGTLSNIVAKCLEKDPANRYQSATELDADLRAWQTSGGKKVSASSMRLRMNRLRELPWQSLAFAGVLIVAIAAGMTWMVVRRQQAAKSGPPAPISVLVADFANNTGDPLLDNTLEPMVGLALEGASFINVFGREDARKVAEKLPNPSDKLDQPTALRVALNQGIYTVITGDISLRGDGYEITAIALDPSSRKVLATKTITVGDKKDILSSLPTLVDPIRTALGDTEPPEKQFNEVSGGFKAASLEAVHQDSIGVDEQFAGKFQDAFDSFQKAAQLDPNFARAYTGMAAMDENLGKQEDALKYMNLAMQHKDNMTEREQYRDLGLFYRTKGAWKDCVDEYGKLVAKYPADRVGWNNLSLCDAQLRDEPGALQAAQKAVDIVPKGVGPRLNLAFISVLDGDFAGGEKAAGYALSINPKAAQGILIEGEAQLGEGEIDKAADTYKQLDAFGPAATSTAAAALADLAAYQGKFADAAGILTQGAAADLAAKDNDSAARKFVALASVEEMQEKNSAAVADADKALKNSQTMQIEFLAARNYVDAGELAKAQKLAMTLSSSLTNESQAYGKIIDGLIALRKKDANGAIRQIKDANGLLNTWIGHFDLGRAYLAAAAFTEADAEFDTCVKRKGEAIELFMDNVPTYTYLPPVYYDEGSAQEGMKVAGFAELYKTYLSIRGQSTEDPLVAEVRHRIGQ